MRFGNNKGQTNALESVVLGGAKKILGCSSKTCNEAVRGDMGLETLRSRRDKAKLKWWYKLATMHQDRYPKQLFSQKWNVKPRRGRQSKIWGKVIDDFLSLGLDKCEWLERKDSSLATFMSCVLVTGNVGYLKRDLIIELNWLCIKHLARM